jgi:hypothetical protein
VHIQFGSFAIITGPGLTIQTPRHEVFIGRSNATEIAPRLDCWRAHGALYIQIGLYEVVANRRQGWQASVPSAA